LEIIIAFILVYAIDVEGQNNILVYVPLIQTPNMTLTSRHL